ncbi:MAG: glucosamine--fructose-6-phosphate aminotransferase (isomerizing) [Chlamydiales bacterium]|jgi:glucosamine--fructose-6-phosphate aminotransferase (isomerizing)
MCGIVGTIRRGGSVVEGLIEGLRVLEYRGYDSSGIAVVRSGSLEVRKRAGRLDRLREVLGDDLVGCAAGIGHTRWATHGAPIDANAHPHTAGGARIAVVHNGIFENYLELKAELQQAGVTFESETDTEVLAHLIDAQLAKGSSLADATRASLRRIQGYYAIAVLSVGDGEGELVCARQGPPLAVAVTPDAAYLASDVLGLVKHTRDVTFLVDGDVVELRPGSLRITDLDGTPVERPVDHVDWDAEDAGKGTFPHFMLKEIHEQPDVLARTAFARMDDERGDFHFENGGFDDELMRSITRVQVAACGTALHAGWIARYLIEGLARVPVDVDFASEFRYRDPCLLEGTLCLAFSQSGETADTLAATRLARELGATTAAICNVEGSTQVRECDQVILTHAGPEIGVASTKAFVAQVAAAFMLAVRMGRARGTLDLEQGQRLLADLRQLRPLMDSLLSESFTTSVREIAARYKDAKGFLFLGRGINFPVALEGALKLKEISYMHAEGYPAGEMKHGPIALIEPGMAIVSVNSVGKVAEKVRANIEQVKARGGEVISVGSDPQSHSIADASIHVPETSEWVSPILNTIPLQFLAYYIAEMRGCDIDKPRNLAKSVTVE